MRYAQGGGLTAEGRRRRELVRLEAALQARWEESLRERAAIDPHSPVPLLDNLLAPFRAALARHPVSSAPG